MERSSGFRAQLVATVALALPLIVGCGRGASPSVPVMPTPTAVGPTSATTPPSATPLPTLAPPTPPASPGTSPPSSGDPTDAARLNRFWLPLNDFECIEMIADKFWESLARMTRDVDFVVVGRPVAVEERRVGEFPLPITIIRVEVAEVLKGHPVVGDTGTIEMSIGSTSGTVIEVLRQNLPSNTHLLFLSDQDNFPYYLPTPYQNVFVDLDGVVEVPVAREIRQRFGADAFPLGQRGRPFADLLADVRRAATSGESRVPAGMGATVSAC